MSPFLKPLHEFTLSSRGFHLPLVNLPYNMLVEKSKRQEGLYECPEQDVCLRSLDSSESGERRSFPPCRPKGQRSQHPPRTAKSSESLDLRRSVCSICPGRPNFWCAIDGFWTHPAWDRFLNTYFLLSPTSEAPWLVRACSFFSPFCSTAPSSGTLLLPLLGHLTLLFFGPVASFLRLSS